MKIEESQKAIFADFYACSQGLTPKTDEKTPTTPDMYALADLWHLDSEGPIPTTSFDLDKAIKQNRKAIWDLQKVLKAIKGALPDLYFNYFTAAWLDPEKEIMGVTVRVVWRSADKNVAAIHSRILGALFLLHGYGVLPEPRTGEPIFLDGSQKSE